MQIILNWNKTGTSRKLTICTQMFMLSQSEFPVEKLLRLRPSGSFTRHCTVIQSSKSQTHFHVNTNFLKCSLKAWPIFPPFSCERIWKESNQKTLEKSTSPAASSLKPPNGRVTLKMIRALFLEWSCKKHWKRNSRTWNGAPCWACVLATPGWRHNRYNRSGWTLFFKFEYSKFRRKTYFVEYKI